MIMYLLLCMSVRFFMYDYMYEQYLKKQFWGGLSELSSYRRKMYEVRMCAFWRRLARALRSGRREIRMLLYEYVC